VDRSALALRPDGLRRVEREIDQDLLDLGAVERHERKVARDVEDRLDPARPERVRLQIEHAIDQVGQ
jgi:hypothetical protein